ncbi:MAG: hypothetical protein DMF93_10920 [Acidobacteria bacterium]|nr:MAG: hypothetical protein DMF93_10920 [Acidobacteriota bacterium]
MDARLVTPFRVLRFAFGLTATLAGLDKFFNVLADWGSYVSPVAAHVLPFSIATFMGIVGVVEIAVGAAILMLAPRVGAYVASAWLLLVAANLALGAHFDIAVRDIVLSIAAFTLARALEAIVTEPARAAAPASSTRVVTA